MRIRLKEIENRTRTACRDWDLNKQRFPAIQLLQLINSAKNQVQDLLGQDMPEYWLATETQDSVADQAEYWLADDFMTLHKVVIGSRTYHPTSPFEAPNETAHANKAVVTHAVYVDQMAPENSGLKPRVSLDPEPTESTDDAIEIHYLRRLDDLVDDDSEWVMPDMVADAVAYLAAYAAMEMDKSGSGAAVRRLADERIQAARSSRMSRNRTGMKYSLTHLRIPARTPINRRPC